MTILAHKKPLLIFALLLSFFTACNTYKPYYNGKHKEWKQAVFPSDSTIVNSIFLLGDAGLPSSDKQEPTLKLLQQHLNANSDSNNTVVFLGDNIYPSGLPDTNDSQRKEAERRIVEQLKLVENFNGNTVFIPGNHDWKNSRDGGYDQVRRQEKFIETYLDKGNVFIPSNGCPGPVEVNISPLITLIVIDSEWWLHEHKKPKGPYNICGVEDKFDFIVQLEDIIEKNKNKHVVIAQHHPLFSNGEHGGHYTLKDHIFPLTLVRRNLYIPLPVVGSVYPLARKGGVSPQDIANPNYQQMKKAMLAMLKDKKNVVFAAGHEHSLQFHKYKQLNHIVSGSSTKSSFVSKGNDASFVHRAKGFAKINYYKNGESWVEFWEPEEDGSKGKVVFRTPLGALNPEEAKQIPEKEIIDYSDSTVTAVAGTEYKSSALWQVFMGKHYRKEWITPVEVPYLDINSEAGGLTPYKKGGGKQTLSMRFKGADNHEYTLRSINKNPGPALPAAFRNTFIHSLTRDQISSAHPYGALVIPSLAKPLDINHAQPKLFYTPYSSLLGTYLDDFGGTLALLEVRPDEDLSEMENFDNTKNAVSTTTMVEHLEEDNDNEVNQKLFLKTRLFDMLIGDWDRHQDQWRWAEFEKEKGSLFNPIPRDRDHVFSLYDGVFPYLFTRKWAVRTVKHFGYKFHDVIGLNTSGENVDRRFLNAMTKDDWMSMVDTINTYLTDEIIDDAMKELPKEVYSMSGPEIAAKLKSRKKDLRRAALKYYQVLAKEVNIVGSDKHELFKVTRINENETKVEVWKIQKDEDVKKKLYERTFYTNETKEIRLYGLEGEDIFEVDGDVNKGIKIRIIGGEDDDKLINRSNVSGLAAKTIYYDLTTEDNKLDVNKDTKLKTSKHDWVNKYDWKDHKYNYAGPRLLFEFNQDDGIYVGGGALIERHGFRKDPFKTKHLILANYAFRTNSHNLKYRGEFISIFGRKNDFVVNAKSFGPRFVFNYFGKGNNTERGDEPIDYHRIRMNSIQVQPSFRKRFTDYFSLSFAPVFQYYNIKSEPNNIVNELAINNPAILDETFLTGVSLKSEIERTDNTLLPKSGVKWTNEITYLNSFKGQETDFSKLSSEFSFYHTPNLPVEVTFAFRAGAAVNLGEAPFYHSNFLGGRSNLRGLRNTRFAGDANFYQNTEARVKVGNIRHFLFKGTWGVIGFFDQGKVWSDNENSSRWHTGYGPGAYANFFDMFTISGFYGISKESEFFNLKLGMFF